MLDKLSYSVGKLQEKLVVSLDKIGNGNNGTPLGALHINTSSTSGTDTALFIAENASASITGPTNISTFTQDVADRYNIQYDGSDGTITNDIYLNATEQQIDEVLASPNGLVSSAQAFNFGFYTQFQIGETTLNIKLQQDTPPSEDVIAVNDPLIFEAS